MPAMDEACSGSTNPKTQSTSPLLMKVKLGRPRKGTVAPTACLSEDDKKGRRRAANRESARRMRARRAENVAQLTSQVTELKNRCERLHNHNQAIRLNWKKVTMENSRLRAQFQAMQSSLGSSGTTLALPDLSPPATLPPELDDAAVAPFEEDPSLSIGQNSSTNDTDLLSCLTPDGFHSPDPSSQPAVSSPGAQQVPQLQAANFTPPCSPSSSQPLIHEHVSPFASAVPQVPSCDPPAPPVSLTPRLKGIHSAPQSASLPPQWGHPNHQLAAPSAPNANAASHGTVVLDPLPTVTSTTNSPHPTQPQPAQPCSLPSMPPRLSHPLTLRTDFLPEHLHPSSLLHPSASHPMQTSAPTPWTPPLQPISAPLSHTPLPPLPSLLDALDHAFPFPTPQPSSTPDLLPDPTAPPHHHNHPPAHHPQPHRSFSKQLDAMPSLNAFPRSFSKQLETVPSLGHGDPLQRLFNSWDILSCLPPNRQASLDPMASMGSLPLLDDNAAFLPSDLHTHGPPDAAAVPAPLLPKLTTHPAFFR